VSLSEAAAILRVTVRTAASAGIGAGHVARTTAVAAQLARIGADVRWACDEATVAYLVERGVRADRIHVLRHAATAGRSGEAEATDAAQAEDARETLALGPADCALVDSYQLGVAWQRTARAAGVRVAAFDDLAERPVEADLVINAAASPGGYDALAPNARVLAGLPYAITGDPSRPPAAGPGTLLLAFGAADPGNLTEATLRALAELRDAQGSPFPETVIQLGSGASGRPKVAELVATLAWATFATAGPTSPGAPAIAIGAAGVGLLERMQAGVPSVVVVAAPNQRALADAAKRSGAAVAVADVRAACAEALRLLADPAALARMSAAGRAAVDGRGAARVARELNRLAGVDLRRATLHDAELLHRWRNDPSVRAVSHTTDEIPWETHVRWLESSLARGDRHVLVAERRGRPLGTLRFDVSGDRATVSIAVDPALHGSGLGPAILDAGDAWLKANDARVRTCRAEIRDGNDASVRAFLAAGYLPGNDSYERPVGRRTEA
jgi:spore coat polysaccharide biosynthesis predicted glycosyltransferase SpsG/RimJ/RimL family protein N-acetyltransferase